MKLEDFEQHVDRSWKTPEEVTIAVAALGLAGEAGEVADILKKLIGHPWDTPAKQQARRADLVLELGDVLFYWVKLAHLFGLTSGQIMQANKDKLDKRTY